MAQPPTLTTPPPPLPPTILLSFPAPHILLVTLNRPDRLNALPTSHHPLLSSVWAWYDAEPTLRCAVLTGAGPRAFCAGADLVEWDANLATPSPSSPETKKSLFHPAGFGGLSNHPTNGPRKPLLAAVNGVCLGGGMEMALCCDILVADGVRARFGLPEVTVGVVAIAGALPRLTRIVGRQRASEMAILGRTTYTAEEMARWGVVNFVVGEGEALGEALRLAGEVVSRCSPDAVVVTKEGLRGGWDGVGVGEATQRVVEGVWARMDGGENMKEGVKSFLGRRKAVWVDCKL
ncbi:ClpP/crotonase [Podospora conica]|nr:ClpP/crotonase [Schizothecium conicum]